MATIQMKVSPEDLSQVPPSRERVPDPVILTIFGASGDLTKRKLLPALFHLEQNGLLPAKFAIVGVARRTLGDEFAQDMRQGIVEFGGVDAKDAKIDSFVKKISYFALDFGDPGHYEALNAELARIASENGIGNSRLFYLRNSSGVLHRDYCENLGAQGEWRMPTMATSAW